MKKYIKSSLSVNNPADVDEIIKNFNPYIANVDYDFDFYGEHFDRMHCLINDKNSDFSKSITARVDDGRYVLYYEWDHRVLSYADAISINRIMDNDYVQERTLDAIYSYLENV